MTRLLAGMTMLLLLSCCEAHASRSCMSHSEARQAYPRAYLYWSGGGRGQRCWSNRRGRHRVIPARALVVQASVPKAQEALPAEPKPKPYQPQWGWVFDVVANPLDLSDEYYSTFPPGEEPDVWPRLETAQVNKDGTVMLVTLSAMTLVLAIMFQRWRARRIRITW